MPTIRHYIYSLLHDALPFSRGLHYNRLFYYPQLAFQKGLIPKFQIAWNGLILKD